MARVNVYLPDELAEEVRSADLNVSGIVQEALQRELARHRTDEWLDSLSALPSSGVTHEQALSSLEAARDEMYGGEHE